MKDAMCNTTYNRISNKKLTLTKEYVPVVENAGFKHFLTDRDTLISVLQPVYNYEKRLKQEKKCKLKRKKNYFTRIKNRW